MLLERSSGAGEPGAATPGVGAVGETSPHGRALAAIGVACALAIGGEAALLRTQAALPALPLFGAAIFAGGWAARRVRGPAKLLVGQFTARRHPLWLFAAAATLFADGDALVILGRPGPTGRGLLFLALSLGVGLLCAWLLDGCPRPSLRWRSEGPALALVAALTLLGALLRLLWLDRVPYGFWFDEAYAGLLAQHLLGDPAYRPVFIPFPGPGTVLFPYLLMPSFQVFGPTVLAVRLASAVGGIAGIVAVYLAGRELFGRTVGLLATAITTPLVWHVTLSRIAIEGDIWAVTLNMLALFFLVYALKRGSFTAAALAGVSLGLSLNIYLTGREMAVVLAFALAAFWLGQPKARFRTVALASLTFVLTTLLWTSPLIVYAIQHPDEFNQRLATLTVFNEIRAAHSWQPLFDNIRAHLLMFNLAGDHNGRHNLPNAPELNVLLAGLFVLGLGISVVRGRRPEFLLLPFWGVVMLSGGVFSVTFEAPQSLRTFDEINVVVMLAALPLALAIEAAGPLARRAAGGRGRRAAPAVTLLAASALVICSGVIDIHRYFVIQQHDRSVYAEHSTTATITARQVQTLPAGTTVYIDQNDLNQPTLQFLAPQLKQQPFSVALLPLRAAAPTAIYLSADNNDAALAEIRSLYAHASIQGIVPPFDGPPFMYAIRLQPADIGGIQGVRASFHTPAAAIARTLPTVNLAGADLPLAAPATVDLRSVLVAPDFGDYTFLLQGPAGAMLTIDGRAVPTGSPARLQLARGNHALAATATLGKGDTLRLLWQPPSASALALVPQQALYADRVSTNGLLGSYYANADWTPPAAFQQIDPEVDFDYHLLPLDRPFSVEWTGQVAAPVAGIYQFGSAGVDTSQVYVDGRLVEDNQQPNALKMGAITLTAGRHGIRLRYKALGNFNHIELYWQPPGRDQQVIPSAYLYPSVAASQAQPLPALPAAAPGSAPAPPPSALPPKATSLPVAQQIDVSALSPGSMPRGLAVDSAGNVYVADGGRPALDKLDARGRIVWSAAPPADAGKLQAPDAVALEADGSILLLDAADGTIYRFSPSGQYLDKRGGPALGTYNPRGLAVAPTGDIYVADTGKGRVLRLTPSGQIAQSFGVPGTGKGALREPTGVAVLSDGRVAVLDPTLDKIVIFAPSGGAEREWSFPHNATVAGPQLVLARGDLWATDRQGARVLRFDLTGVPLGSYTAGGLAGPNGLAVTANAVYVSDPGAKRIVELSLSQ